MAEAKLFEIPLKMSETCWEDDINKYSITVNDQWDTYYNSSIERLMREETSVSDEVSWLIDNYPQTEPLDLVLYNCLNK